MSVAPGRKAARSEDGFKNIGILVTADPAQRIKLEGAFDHVGIKGGELKGADVERDAHLAQLLLQDGGKQASGFFSGGLHGEMKANTAGSGAVSGLVEKLPGKRGIVGIVRA